METSENFEDDEVIDDGQNDKLDKNNKWEIIRGKIQSKPRIIKKIGKIRLKKRKGNKGNFRKVFTNVLC